MARDVFESDGFSSLRRTYWKVFCAPSTILTMEVALQSNLTGFIGSWSMSSMQIIFFFRFVYCVRYRPVNAYHKSSFNILHARTRLVLYDDGAEKLRFLPEPSLCITHDLERSRTWQSPGAFGLLPDVETRVLLFGCGLLEGPSSRTWPSQKGRLTNLTFP
jgi:hypothetical protein